MSDAYEIKLRMWPVIKRWRCDCGTAWESPGDIRLTEAGDKVCHDCASCDEIDHLPQWSGYNAVLRDEESE